MNIGQNRRRKKTWGFAAVILIVNLIAIVIIGVREVSVIDRQMEARAGEAGKAFAAVMENYKHSFRLFVELMDNEIENASSPDDIWDYLKGIDSKMLEIEGDTFDGLYMYYQGRYLYSWDTPYSQYEETGYVATERPWYKDAVAGKGEIVFTPPYMSYANHYILTTLSQLQPDGETVFAYDIKMGDIQELVATAGGYDGELLMIYDINGTIIGSTRTDYLGGNFYDPLDVVAQSVSDVTAQLETARTEDVEQVSKLEEQRDSANIFYDFRKSFDGEYKGLAADENGVSLVKLDGRHYFGILTGQEDYHFLVMVPMGTMIRDTMIVWLLPLLVVELLLIYLLGRVSRDMKNRELKNAYVELGQTQKRLEVALHMAQKEAAIDDLTGMMNFKSFRTKVDDLLMTMEKDARGILIMIDGDHFKQINDQYGHNIGDEVIKLTAQMIIGRIRIVDLASRLHGDEFAIFVANTSDYSVARGIMSDINDTLKKEAARRNMPSITLSAGGVVAKRGDTYMDLAKRADAALYRAKETHDGKFAY